MNFLDMNDRHAVITGGAAGLGYAIAQRMIGSGARVTLWDRDTQAVAAAADKLKRARAGAVVASIAVDVASHEAVADATKQTLAMAEVDALVNSAGVTGPNAKLWEYPVDAWRQVFDVNVHGLFYCCREFFPPICAHAITGALSTLRLWPGKTAIQMPAPTVRVKLPSLV